MHDLFGNLAAFYRTELFVLFPLVTTAVSTQP